jgi:ABC-type polysaccharide/polyol phosphate transport system ATPase subunit
VNAVEFERVSKSYPIYDTPGDRLKELFTFNRRLFHRDFHAVRDLSFEIRRGEVFCIVGENGSGKSTTLQLMAGIMQPTAGEARINGRVSALLELGSGFNPEFTGRDNVYLNASILGISKREVDRRYRQIEEFAEIGAFIDQPVKTYSSGMVLRLAFAVAIHVDPEVLIVDEALAVGDTSFRHRCLRKVHELRARGVTIVFVSHSVADVSAIGDRVLWLEHGRAQACGDPETILDQYLAAMSAKAEHYRVTSAPFPEEFKAAIEPVHSIPNIDRRQGDRRAEILGVTILNQYSEPLHLMLPGIRIIVRLTFRSQDDLMQPVAGFILRNHLGLDFSETSTGRDGRPLPPLRRNEITTVDFHLDIPELYPAAFSFSPWISEGGSVCDRIDNAITVQMGHGEGPVYGLLHIPSRIELSAAQGGERPLAALESRIA